MKPKQTLNKRRTNKTVSSTSFPAGVIPSVCVLVCVSFLSSLNKKPRSDVLTSGNPSLETIELDPSYASQNQAKAQAEAPHYGLQNQTVKLSLRIYKLL